MDMTSFQNVNMNQPTNQQHHLQKYQFYQFCMLGYFDRARFILRIHAFHTFHGQNIAFINILVVVDQCKESGLDHLGVRCETHPLSVSKQDSSRCYPRGFAEELPDRMPVVAHKDNDPRQEERCWNCTGFVE